MGELLDGHAILGDGALWRCHHQMGRSGGSGSHARGGNVLAQVFAAFDYGDGRRAGQEAAQGSIVGR